MDLKVKRIGITSKLAAYTVEGYPELSAVSSIHNTFVLGLFQLRHITVINNQSDKIYELKQTNFILKLLLCTVLALFHTTTSPAYNFFINGVKYGKFIEPLAVIDGKEYEFRYKKEIYEFSFHRPNTIAVLRGGEQIMKMLFEDIKQGGNYSIKYDTQYINDIMLIFIITVYMDNAILPLDYRNIRVFGYRNEKFPERIEWIPSDEVRG